MADQVPFSSVSSAKGVLRRCLQEDAEVLLDAICAFVLRFGLAEGDARTVAMDVLQEVSVEALEHASRFEPARRPIPWLLGIAMNVLRRRRVARARQWSRESTGSTVGFAESAIESGTASAALAATIESPDPLGDIEAQDTADRLLLLIPASDAKILRLAVLEGWDNSALAQQLGTSPGAARVRLHRAIKRLRAAWMAQDALAHGGDQ